MAEEHQARHAAAGRLFEVGEKLRERACPKVEPQPVPPVLGRRSSVSHGKQTS
jgi:hypothetical protein